MKIVIAPDSFKNSLSARDAADAIDSGLRLGCPGVETVRLPLADGGEGTVEALVAAASGEFRSCRVTGPLGAPVEARYGRIDGGRCAVIEMAAASGIELVKQDRLDPLAATTYGTGELIRDAVRTGAQRIVVGIGGSMTCDGGAGMAQALGWRFYGESGNLLAAPLGGGDLAKIAGIRAPEERPECEILVACDVTNPLLGPRGCVNVFAPQKGATAEMLPVLERNLRHYAEKLKEAGFAASCDAPGDGAAGGLGFALRTLLGAKMTSGADLVMEAAGLDDALEDADFLITGEGRTDDQTLSGKLCFKAALRAARRGVPTIVLSGAIAGDPEKLREHFFALFSIAPGPGTLEEALRDTAQNLRRVAVDVGRLLSKKENL